MVNLNAHEAGNGGEPRNTYSPSCFPLLGDLLPPSDISISARTLSLRTGDL
jgi:hypothetical protein